MMLNSSGEAAELQLAYGAAVACVIRRSRATRTVKVLTVATRCLHQWATAEVASANVKEKNKFNN